MRNLREATPNSSQRSSLMKANGPAIPYNREKRRNGIQDLQHLESFNAGRQKALRNNRRTSTSLKPSLADCVAAGATEEAARLTAGTIVWAMDREMEVIMTSCSLWDVLDENFVVFYE